MIPELGVGVAVFANLNLTLAPEAIRGHVLEQFTGGAPSDMQEKIWQTQQKLDAMFAVEPAGTKQPAGPPTRPLASYAGKFTSPLYGRFTVSVKNDGLCWTLGNQGYGGALAHVGFDTFQMEFPPGTVSLPEPVTFILGEDGSAAAAESELLGRMPRDAAE
jgi:hypothetical protein